MPVSEAYRRQVELLIRLLPLVTQEESFALKGGTAINLFIRDLPRLSVDIDLTYLPIKSYQDSLDDIDAAMKRVEARALAMAGTKVARLSTDPVRSLLVRTDGAQVKVEVTPVLRGTVAEPVMMPVADAVEDSFGFAEARVVSFDDLYAGKLVAAIDRQHPRDLFDVRELLDTDGISPSLREAFIVYILSHHRPMGEVLLHPRKDRKQEFERNFVGMTDKLFSLEDVARTQDDLHAALLAGMPAPHRDFLIGFESGTPNWSLLAVAHANTLPAVLWRQQNLNQITKEKRDALVKTLADALSAPDE